MATITDQHAGGHRTTGKRWLARVWDPILKEHSSRAFAEYVQAKYWATETEMKAMQGRTPGVRGDLEIWKDAFLNDSVHLTESYRQQVRIVVTAALAAGLRDPGDQLAPARIRSWLQELRKGARSESTVLRYFAVVRHLIRWATQSGLYCGVDPTLQVQRPRHRAAEGLLREVFTVDELRKLVRDEMRTDPLFMPVCMLTYAGLRMGEVRAACWGWDRGLVLRVESDSDFKPKCHHERQLPIQDELRSLLDGMPRTKPSDRIFPGLWRRDPSDASADVQRYIERAGVERRGRTAHCLRHSWVSLSQAIGVPTGTVQRRAGHNQASTTAIYSRMVDAYLDAAQAWPASNIGHFYLRRAVPPKRALVLAGAPVSFNPDDAVVFDHAASS